MTQYLKYEGAQWQLNKEQKKFFDDMEAEIGVPITVIYAKGQRAERDPETEGLVFFDYSTNDQNPTPRRCDAISRKNATTVPLKNHYLLKPDDAREHIFDFNNFPLCEIRLLTLWGLTPLENFETEALMREFWADAMRMSARETFFKEKEEAKQRKITEAFLTAMKNSNEGAIKAEEKIITDQSTQLAKLNTDLVACTTEMFKADQRLEIAKKIAEGDQSTYESEIVSLMKHNQIARIDYDTGNNILEIYTTELYLYSPNRKERSILGKFTFKVDTKNNNAVTLFNLTNQRSHKMHPHVESNGSACWGAIGTQVAKLAASCKIEGLADLCIRYLETYNVQDGNAQYARYWFTPEDTQTKRSDFDDRWMTKKEYDQAKKDLKAKAKPEVKANGKKEEVKDIPVVTDKALKEIAR